MVSPPRNATGSNGVREGAVLLASTVGLLANVVLIGWIAGWARLIAARLPGSLATSVLDGRAMLATGLVTIAAGALVLVAFGALAYLVYWRRWERHAQDWHDIVLKRGVGNARKFLERREDGGRALEQAPLGDTGVRVIAGFNVVVLAALLALAPTRLVDGLLTSAWWAVLPTWIAAFALAGFLLTRFSPLSVHPWGHGLTWVFLAVGALFASAPLGVLVLTGTAIATGGRALARLARPCSVAEAVRSPLSWALLAVIALVAIAYNTVPPVLLPRAVARTASGELVGGYLARMDGGVYMVTCTPLADATSTDERVQFLAGHDLQRLTLGGPRASVDSGSRPSLVTLLLRSLGLEADLPTFFNADLRARRGTCAEAAPPALAEGSEDPALGRGTIAGLTPPGGRAHDGEPPVQQTAPAPIAALARRYEPTLEVSVPDRFWPVSVTSVLAEQGPDGQRTCLLQRRAPRTLCPPSSADLVGAGTLPGDYLQLPVHITRNSSPNAQLRAFETGQETALGTLHEWLADPGLLHPWHTAQIYFFYAGPLAASAWPPVARDPRVPSGLIGLEYWFFYPYNYYPAAVDARLMPDAPLAAAHVTVDFHQGDWEHVTVLLDPRTLTPRWLYTARHAYEGRFYAWDSPSLTYDDGHPIIQAALGGHPSYPAGCGPQRRPVTRNLLSDWLVCGSGRFAFRGSTTPLVDIASTPWACWPGHFGEAATPAELGNAGQHESTLDKLKHQVLVAGPISPLRQAENNGTCHSDPRTPERQAARQPPLSG